jgi:hypothetical protein
VLQEEPTGDEVDDMVELNNTTPNLGNQPLNPLSKPHSQTQGSLKRAVIQMSHNEGMWNNVDEM